MSKMRKKYCGKISYKVINVQEEHIERLNVEYTNNNKKIESLEIENNILKEQDYEPTEEIKNKKIGL